MKVKTSNIYYLIEGEPYLSIAQKFKIDYISSHIRVAKYLESIGVSRWQYGWGGYLCGVIFDEYGIRDGFKKPNYHGVTYPKKKSKFYDEFISEKYRRPQIHEYVKNFDVPCAFSYKSKSGTGWRRIGHSIEPIEICWYSSKKDAPFLLKIPNVPHSIEMSKIQTPDITFEDNIDKWKMNETGLKPILLEEWDLMVAKYNAKSGESE